MKGEKGDLLIRWLTIELLPAMLIVVLTLAPLIPVSLNNLEYNERSSIQCGYKVPASRINQAMRHLRQHLRQTSPNSYLVDVDAQSG